MIPETTANIKATCASFTRPLEQNAVISTRYSMISKARSPHPPCLCACTRTHTHTHAHMHTTFRQYFVSKWQRTSFIHSKCLELWEREISAGDCHLLVRANTFSILPKKARCKKSGILPGSHVWRPTSPELLQHTKPPGTAQHFGLSCVTCPNTTHSSNGGGKLVPPRCTMHPGPTSRGRPQLRHSLPMPRPRYLRSRSFPGLCCCLLVEEAAAAAPAPASFWRRTSSLLRPVR